MQDRTSDALTCLKMQPVSPSQLSSPDSMESSPPAPCCVYWRGGRALSPPHNPACPLLRAPSDPAHQQQHFLQSPKPLALNRLQQNPANGQAGPAQHLEKYCPQARALSLGVPSPGAWWGSITICGSGVHRLGGEPVPVGWQWGVWAWCTCGLQAYLCGVLRCSAQSEAGEHSPKGAQPALGRVREQSIWHGSFFCCIVIKGRMFIFLLTYIFIPLFLALLSQQEGRTELCPGLSLLPG